MPQNTPNSESLRGGQPMPVPCESIFGRIVRTCICRAADFLRKHETVKPDWLSADDEYSRQTRSRYEIYTEDIGPLGLKNIQILLDRRRERLPGSTVHANLIGRDRGTAEASLKIDIVTTNEEAVLELAAEIRRANGQSWVGVYVTTGTFIELAGPKNPILEIHDHAPDERHDGCSPQIAVNTNERK
jgi:hypothetical protein